MDKHLNKMLSGRIIGLRKLLNAPSLEVSRQRSETTVWLLVMVLWGRSLDEIIQDFRSSLLIHGNCHAVHQHLEQPVPQAL